MSIKFEYEGKTFEVDSPEQVVALLDLLDKRSRSNARRLEYSERVLEMAQATTETNGPSRIWTPTLFRRFIARLGPRQISILEWLVQGTRAKDSELRALVGAADNLALAGILSGISKHAIAVDMPARSVFNAHNLRSKGSRIGSMYEVAKDFARIAGEVRWPADTDSEFPSNPNLGPNTNTID